MSVQSVDRVFDILELLSKEREGMTLTGIGKSLDLHKSTVHRLLGVLKSRGYIEQAEQSGRYRLGLGFIALSSGYLNNLEIKTEAEPYMRRLSGKLGETVFLATLKDGEVVYLDKVERFDGLRRYSIIGQRAPVHCTSLGKSLLMNRSLAEIKEIIARRPLVQVTPKTITDIDTLLRQLEESRIRGWSRDDEENEPGVFCAGAPVMDYRGETIAAVSSAWEGRKSGREIQEIGVALKSTAELISRHLGFFPPQRNRAD